MSRTSVALQFSLLLLALVLTEAASSRGLRRSTWHRLPGLDGYLGRGTQAWSRSSSRLQCIRSCLAQPSCSSVTFDPGNSSCFLYPHCPSLPEMALPSASTFCRGCPDDWDLYNGSLCLKTLSDVATWSEAVDRCSMYGGQLALAPSFAKMHALRIYSVERNLPVVWLGAHRNLSSSTWHWLDSPAPAYIVWASAQPVGSHDCLVLRGTSYGGISAQCVEELHFLCEMVP